MNQKGGAGVQNDITGSSEWYCVGGNNGTGNGSYGSGGNVGTAGFAGVVILRFTETSMFKPAALLLLIP